MAIENTLPQSILDCVHMLTSDAVFLVLSNLTGLKLHPLAADSDDSESEGESEPDAKRPKSSSSASETGVSETGMSRLLYSSKLSASALVAWVPSYEVVSPCKPFASDSLRLSTMPGTQATTELSSHVENYAVVS